MSVRAADRRGDAGHAPGTDDRPGPAHAPRDRWHLAALVVAVAVVGATLAVVVPGQLRLPVVPQDEGTLLVYPVQMLHGAVPNRAFTSVYGTVNLWVLAVAFKVLGVTVTTERLVGLAYRAVIVAGLVALVWRRHGAPAAAVAGGTAVLFFAGLLGLVAYAWLAALAFASVALVLLAVPTERGAGTTERGAGTTRDVVAGACFGLAIGCRLDLGLAVVLVLAALLLTQAWRLPRVLAGVAAGLLPVVVNVVRAGPAAVLRHEVLQPIFVSEPARRVPLSTLSWEQLAIVSLCVAVAVVGTVVSLVRLRRKRSDAGLAVQLSVLAFDLGLLPEMFQRSDFVHVGLVACFVLPTSLLLAPTTTWRRRAPSLRTVARSAAVPLLLVVAAYVLAGPLYGEFFRAEASAFPHTRPPYSVTNQGRSLPVGSPADVAALTGLARTLDHLARPGQRLFVGPADLRTAYYNDTDLYFLFPHLVPGSTYLEMDPGVSNARGSGLARQLAADAFLVLSTRYDAPSSPASAAPLGPAAPDRVVTTDFHRVGAWGPWTLWAHDAAS